MKELSWAEPGRRVGHRELKGKKTGVNVHESATERGGVRERFSAGTGTWWLGVDRKRKGKEGAEFQLEVVLRQRERAGMRLGVGMEMLRHAERRS